MIRKEVAPAAPRQGKRRRTIGMFPDFEAPDLAAFRRLRRSISSRFGQRLRTGRNG
jgi:hypothetical protein